jgi:hypothetical protein
VWLIAVGVTLLIRRVAPTVARPGAPRLAPSAAR